MKTTFTVAMKSGVFEKVAVDTSDDGRKVRISFGPEVAENGFIILNREALLRALSDPAQRGT